MLTNTGTISLPNLTEKASSRILSVDILRGIIMIVMALDHTRDFFSNYKGDPLDFQHASLALFFTRWITHYCAPVFVFLSGASAFLSLSRGKTKNQAAWMLFTRGVWLIILELTIIRLGWAFNLDYHFIFVQVIWAIGCSMIFLSILVFFPLPVILFIGLTIVFGHNAFDNLKPADFSHPLIWDILHKQGSVPLSENYNLFVIYPLIPWIGVMAIGYCFGSILLKPLKERNNWLIGIGATTILFFIVLRYTNAYGDPNEWHKQGSIRNTVLDFIKCQKYPPSLLYLGMTIGPAIIIMPLLEKLNNGLGRFFMVYGRVPLFYYILHIFLIHGMALITGLIMGFPVSRFTGGFFSDPASTWGFSLGTVYLFWMAAIAILYLPCRWFMRIKMKHKKWWLSYI